MSMAYDTSIRTGQLQLDVFWVFEAHFAAQVILMNLHRHYLIVLQLVFQWVTVHESNSTAIKVQYKIKISVRLTSALRWTLNWEMNCICRDLIQQGHGPLILFIIFQCSIITSKKLWIVILLLVNCYNNDSPWNKATDLHLTVVYRRGSIWQVKTRRWTWLFYKRL